MNTTDKNKSTCLVVAIRCDQSTVVELLLQNGADIYLANSVGSPITVIRFISSMYDYSRMFFYRVGRAL